ncbi:MAG: MFS transporter, partial [Microvirga sp.]
RIPFLVSVVMVAVGLWVRLNLVESAAFEKAKTAGKVQRLPLASVFKTHWRELILGTFYMLATYVLFYLMTTYSLSFGRAATDAAVPGLGYSYNTFVLMMILGVVFFAIFTLLSGPWADKWGRRKTLIVVTSAIAVFGLLWVPMLSAGYLGVQAWLILGFALMGMTFGPMGALLPELFPTRVRYTGASVTYNLAGIVGASGAPFAAQWLAGWGGIGWVGLYLAVAAGISLAAIACMPETGRDA